MGNAVSHPQSAVPGIPLGGELRQFTGLFRLDWKRFLTGKRIKELVLFSAVPLALVVARFIHIYFAGDGFFQETINAGATLHTPAEATLFFGKAFQIFILRFVLFFSCLYFFANLFRGELSDRTLHLYFLTPVRRSLIVTSRFLFGLTATFSALGLVTLLCSVLTLLPHGGRVLIKQLFLQGGWKDLLLYVCVTWLACLAYGAIFMLLGLVFKNPMVAGVLLYGWEILSSFLPLPLKAMSIVYYLNSLMPVRLMEKTPFAVVADPASPLRVLVTLLAVTLVFLALSAFAVRRKEIDYGGERV